MPRALLSEAKAETDVLTPADERKRGEGEPGESGVLGGSRETKLSRVGAGGTPWPACRRPTPFQAALPP